MKNKDLESFLSNYKKQTSFNKTTQKYIDLLLNDIKNTNVKLETISNCACGSDSFSNISKIDRFGLAFNSLLCNKCGLINTSPRIKEESLAYYYSNFYHYLIYGNESLESRTSLFSPKQGNKIFNLTKNLLKDLKALNILEIGCGTGSVLCEFREEANAHGIKTVLFGTGYSQECIEQCNKKDINIISNNFEEILSDEIKYDLIILSHVFEHFIDLKKVLNFIYKLLKDRGVLFIEVPGVLKIHENPYYKMNFEKYLIHAHIYNFSLDSLKTILTQNNFICLYGNEYVEAVFKKGISKVTFQGDKLIKNYLDKLSHEHYPSVHETTISSEKLFVYIDPGYTSGLGHYRNFAQKIHRYCTENNIEITHYVNKNIYFEDKKRFQLNPVFNYHSQIDDEDMTYTAIENRLNDFEENIKNIFLTLKEKEKDYKQIKIFMYTCHPLHIEILTRLHKEFNLNTIELHLVMLQLNQKILFNKKNKTMEDLLSTINNRILKNIQIYFDSSRALKIYQNFFDKNIKILPIPLHHEKELNLNFTKHKSEKLTIAFFGYANIKYGFHLFYDLYCYFGNKFNYIVRLNKKIHDIQFDNAINILKNDSNILFIDEYIEENYYTSLIHKSDIIIIPYLQETYPAQTSGIFIDSLWYDSFVIATNNTWMADIIKRTNNGLVFENNDVQSLIIKVLLAKKILETNSIIFENNEKLNYTVEKMFKIIDGEINE